MGHAIPILLGWLVVIVLILVLFGDVGTCGWLTCGPDTPPHVRAVWEAMR